jgi:hypothetical protein
MPFTHRGKPVCNLRRLFPIRKFALATCKCLSPIGGNLFATCGARPSFVISLFCFVPRTDLSYCLIVISLFALLSPAPRLRRSGLVVPCAREAGARVAPPSAGQQPPQAALRFAGRRKATRQSRCLLTEKPRSGFSVTLLVTAYQCLICFSQRPSPISLSPISMGRARRGAAAGGRPPAGGGPAPPC